MKTTDLGSQSDVAREIGLLIMYAANLEILFVSILTALMGGDETLPLLIAIQVENLSAKMRILFDAAERKLGDPLANIVFAVKEDVQKAISLRNTLAHSLYVFDDATGSFELYSKLFTSRRGRPKCEALEAGVIEKHRETLRQAIERIIQAGGDRLWNPLGAEPPYRPR